VREKKEDRALRAEGARNLYRELALGEKGISFDHFIKVHDKAWIEAEISRLKFREVNVVELMKRILEKLGIEYPDISRLIRIYFSPKLNYVELFPDVLDILRELKKRGYKMVLISNAFPSNKYVFNHFKLYKFFDAALFSYEVGLRKPHPDIFYKALDEVGSLPESSIMIGNDPFTDITGSKVVGMKSVLIVRRRIDKKRAVVPPDFIIPTLHYILEIL